MVFSGLSNTNSSRWWTKNGRNKVNLIFSNDGRILVEKRTGGFDPHGSDIIGRHADISKSLTEYRFNHTISKKKSIKIPTTITKNKKDKEKMSKILLEKLN